MEEPVRDRISVKPLVRIYVIVSEKKFPLAGIEPRSPRTKNLRSERSSTVLAGPGRETHLCLTEIPPYRTGSSNLATSTRKKLYATNLLLYEEERSLEKWSYDVSILGSGMTSYIPTTQFYNTRHKLLHDCFCNTRLLLRAHVNQARKNTHVCSRLRFIYLPVEYQE